jgi:transposase
LLTPVNEFRQYGNEAMAKMLEKSMSKSIKAIEKDIEGVEQKLKQIINDDNDLKRIFNLITSVVGIGFVTAINLIIHTNEFKMLTDVRKLACYCGIAPFEYSSGSSIRGKRRVHPMANRKLKTNLHMGSLVGVQLDPDLKAYYERKVAEGKNKMSILNAVKNKLLARVLAVVKRGEPYEKIFLPKGFAVS